MFRSIPATYRFALGITLLAGLVSCLLRLSPVGLAIEDYLALRFEFAVRNAMGQGPELSPKLKIFNFDDATVSYLQATELGLEDWALVFEALAKSKPRQIIVDKVFAMPSPLSGAPNFVARMRKIDVPLAAGSFVADAALPKRPPVALTEPWNQEAHFRGNARPWRRTGADSEARFVYGPHVDVAAAFSYIGHIGYLGAGRVQPLVLIEPDKVLPHIGFAAAEDQAAGQAGEPVRSGVPDEQEIQVNLPDPQVFTQRTYSMAALIREARNHNSISLIQPGDEVVVLPSMFTGDTDWVMTPAGQLPGAYVVVGMINSVMTQQWLRHADGGFVMVLAGALLGLVCNLGLWGLSFWLVAGLGAVAVAAGGILLFVYFGLLTPWLYALLAYLFAAIGVFAYRSHVERLERLAMDQELATAGLVQRSFFPGPAEDCSAVTVLGHLQASAQCGGDWWWHVTPAPGVSLVFIGDVMGHGLPAALITAMMYAALSSVAGPHSEGPLPSPKQLLEMLNNLLFHAFKGTVTMTMFVGCFDTRSGYLTYANSGHCFPIFFPSPLRTQAPVWPGSKRTVSGNQGVAHLTLQSPSSVMGINADSLYNETQLQLHQQDRFYLYTDGVIESREPNGRAWGRKAFVAYLTTLATLPPKQALTLLAKNVAERSRGRKAEDDSTLVVVEVEAAIRAGNELPLVVGYDD